MNPWDIVISLGLLALVYGGYKEAKRKKGGCASCSKESCPFRKE